VALLAAAQAAELHEIAESDAFFVLGLGRPPTRCETSAQAALAAMTEFQNVRHFGGADRVDALARECQQTVLDHLHTEERWLRRETDWADWVEPEAATASAMTEEQFLADSGMACSRSRP
jgi:broad specificity phosphatase PhoE